MDRTETERLIADFLSALNARDMEALTALVGRDVVHDAPDGQRSVGAEALREGLFRQAAQSEETIADIVVMSDESGMHAAAEFTRRGIQHAAAAEPGVEGRRYAMRDALLFEVDGGRITRVSAARAVQAGGGRP